MVRWSFVGKVGFMNIVDCRESQSFQILLVSIDEVVFSSNPMLAWPKFLESHAFWVVAKVMNSCNNFLSQVMESFLRRRDLRSLAVA